MVFHKDYEHLTALFEEWRTFENTPLLNNAPDYTTETFDKRWPDFLNFKEQLNLIDTTGWPVAQKVDWMVVWAEMNGYDFNHRILKPWQRDPAFYKSLFMERSDVPAHEGPTQHKTLELWVYDFPFTASDRISFMESLTVIPSINAQAQKNLTGNAKNLWIGGIRELEFQIEELASIEELSGVATDAELLNLINTAITSTQSLVNWLKDQAPNKTGPSGIGKENYTWYQQNVHLVPLTWEDEEMLLKRELTRAWSSLALE